MMKGHRQFEHDVYQKFLVNQKNNKPKGDKKHYLKGSYQGGDNKTRMRNSKSMIQGDRKIVL